MILVDEVMALSVDDLVAGVGPFFSEHHVLERGEGFSDFLGIVAFLVDLASILPLVSEGVILASFLDFIFGPLFIVVDKEYFFDIARLHLKPEGEFS